MAELQARSEAFIAGTTQGTVDQLLKCLTTRVLEAELALCQKPIDRIDVYSRALKYAKGVEKVNDIRFKAGRISVQDVKEGEFVRLDIEIKLLEAKEEAAKPERK
jgi:hypothetical protein